MNPLRRAVALMLRRFRNRRPHVSIRIAGAGMKLRIP